MYNNIKILALIPARGGSKGIKDKNIVELCGKPLIAYTIEAAKKSEYIDRVIITTDSEKIAETARRYGAEVPFMRPAELAQDKSKTIDAVLHAVETLKQQGNEYDVLVLLQPTTPLRTAADVDGAIETYFSHEMRGLVSVSPVNDHPLLIRSINGDGDLRPLLSASSTCRRQDMPPFYRVNGCIYINCINSLSPDTSFNDNSIPYIMNAELSVDIDNMEDVYLAEYYIKNKVLGHGRIDSYRADSESAHNS